MGTAHSIAHVLFCSLVCFCDASDPLEKQKRTKRAPHNTSMTHDTIPRMQAALYAIVMTLRACIFLEAEVLSFSPCSSCFLHCCKMCCIMLNCDGLHGPHRCCLDSMASSVFCVLRVGRSTYYMTNFVSTSRIAMCASLRSLYVGRSLCDS